MDIFNQISSNLIQSVLANPAAQAMVIGIIVKVVTDKVKEFLAQVDKGGLPKDLEENTHLIVLACSFLATAGTLALKHQLSQLDVQSAVQFIATLIQTHLLASGAHEAGKAVQAALPAKK